MSDLDREVRLHVFGQVVATRRAPSTTETAAALGVPTAEVEAAYRRLAEGRVLVLTPGTLEVRMANPFSAVPTNFRVETREAWHWGNCAWDALGISAALRADAVVRTTCGDCGAPLHVRVAGGRVHGHAVMHLALPARRWWEDIVFT